MTWIAVGIALAGAALTTYNTIDTAKKADRVAAQGIMEQGRNQQKVNAKVTNILDKTALSDSGDERAANDSNYLGQIQRSMARAKQGLGVRGISEDYDALATQSIGSAKDYAGTVAGLMSRIDAGAQQRQGEANAFGDLGMDLDVLGTEISSDKYLNDMALGNVRRNPYVDFVGGAMSGYGASGGKGYLGKQKGKG